MLRNSIYITIILYPLSIFLTELKEFMKNNIIIRISYYRILHFHFSIILYVVNEIVFLSGNKKDPKYLIFMINISDLIH